MGSWWCILCLKVSTKVEKWGCVSAPHSVFWCVSNYYSAGVTLGPHFCMLSVYLYVYILWVCVFFSYVNGRVCVYVCACLCVCVCATRTGSFSALRISDQLWDRTLDSFIVNKGCRWGVSSHTKTRWSHADQRSAANTRLTHCLSLNKEMRFLIKSVFLPCFSLQAVFFSACCRSCSHGAWEAQICSGFAPQNTDRVFSQSEKPEDYQINVAAFLCWSADLISMSFHGDRLKAGWTLQRLTDRRLRNHKALLHILSLAVVIAT